MYTTPARPYVTRRDSGPSTSQGTPGSLEGPPKQMVPFRYTELLSTLWSTQ
ncbi:Lax1 [Phodopus roborovskii]|uniref:Lax1 protein n=1 Tax=Phodopus roborovskii TaxID=109678 RepID=A0AAV0A550_PHORO|nr:Lax1 [Phodopus roborovskii]